MNKADAIKSKMTKHISQKQDENPLYYDSFSKRIKEILKQYQDKIITDAEYYARMRSIMDDYVSGVSMVKYPEKLKNNVHAQAFYGVVSAILDDEWEHIVPASIAAEGDTAYSGQPISAAASMQFQESNPYKAYDVQNRNNQIADIAIEITNIIEKHSRVDWTHNKSIHNKIAQDIDDLFYAYERAGKCKFSLDVIDKVIENVKTTALRRFKG